MLQTINTKHLFYSLAAFWAAIAPWLFVLNISGYLNLPYGVEQHGHSMLFGFTSALITGYLAGTRKLLEVLWLAALWLATRIIEVFSDNQSIVLVLYIIYGCHLAYIVAPKFLAAKKIRNQIIAPTLAIVASFPIVVLLNQLQLINKTTSTIIFIQVLTLLMFFMAGRMIVPLFARANTARNIHKPHQVQPNIEYGVFATISASILLALANWHFDHSFLGKALTVCHFTIGSLIAIRILRWKPWSLSSQSAPLWGLLVGYTWLAISQYVFAVSSLSAQNFIPSLHITSIGALGVLSTTIMTLSVSKKSIVSTRHYYFLTSFMSGATLARYFASAYIDLRTTLLFISLCLWSATFFLVLKIVLTGSYKLWKINKQRELGV